MCDQIEDNQKTIWVNQIVVSSIGAVCGKLKEVFGKTNVLWLRLNPEGWKLTGMHHLQMIKGGDKLRQLESQAWNNRYRTSVTAWNEWYSRIKS